MAAGFVDRVASEASSIRPLRALLIVLALPFLLLGWVLGLLYVALTWMLGAVKVGITDSRATAVRRRELPPPKAEDVEAS